MVTDVRTLDERGRIRLTTTAEALKVSAGDKVSVAVDGDGVITVTPWEGEALDKENTAASLDARGRLTLPRWARSLAGIGPGDAVLCIGILTTPHIEIASASSFLRIHQGASPLNS